MATGLHQAHQYKFNLTTPFEQRDIDWVHPDLVFMSQSDGIFHMLTFRVAFTDPHSRLMSVGSPFPFAFIDSGLRVDSFAATEI